MNLLYVKISVACVLLLGSFAVGWSIRNRDYMEYKKSVEIAAKTQEAHVESIQKQHELVTKGISDEYDAKLNLIRQYYANGVRQPNSSSVSNISTTSSIANATAAYNELASNCAATTLQLVELQKWINEQMGIK
jgi:low affinity Fe/Cu permease